MTNGHTVYSSGILTDTGDHRVKINLDELYEVILAERAELDEDEQFFVTAQTEGRQVKTYGLPSYISPSDLSDARWGIIWPPEPLTDLEQEHRNALKDLIDHRCQQMGEKEPHEFHYEESWTFDRFLWRVGPGVDTGQIQTEKVPYYLCIVGSPERIPWEFQQYLDGEYAVGRLWFDDPEDCRSYVQCLLAYEKTENGVPVRRNALFVAPQHPGDPATQSSANYLVKPLHDWVANRKTALGFDTSLLMGSTIGGGAFRMNLLQQLARKGPANEPRIPPALLFTAGHGIEYSPPSVAQYERQGALLFQEWSGGPATPSHYLSGAQVSGLGLLGVVGFCFACFSAGTPLEEDWVRPSLLKRPKEIALKPFVARLPQKLLAHGMIGFIGHVSRTWTYSFLGAQLASQQIVPFQDTIYQLLSGQCIGHATDLLNEQWARLTVLLDGQLNNTKKYSKEQVVATWLARNDFRGYVVLGDPAVRIRIEALP